MKIIADTSVWLEALAKSNISKDDKFLSLLIENEEEIYLSGIILQDILSGISDVKQFNEINQILKGFSYIEPEKEDYAYAAEIRHFFNSKGYAPGSIDLLIASLAIRRDYFLATYDRDFHYISKHTGLKIINQKDYRAIKGLPVIKNQAVDFTGNKKWRVMMDYFQILNFGVPLTTLDKTYKGSEYVVKDINLSVKKGEILGIVGPTGCGKTVFLRALAGVLLPIDGLVIKEDKDISDFKPWKRGMSMVFQDYVLYPHFSVKGNIKFPLTQKKGQNYQPNPNARISEIAELLNLDEEELLNRKPSKISGGEKQRVAIGKAISVLPDIMLLDEPLSNVEENFRFKTRHSLKKLIKDNEITAIYVSHNQIEIAEVADRIAVMLNGRIEQVGTYMELYNDPKRFFVSRFIGDETTNFLTIPEMENLTDGKIRYSLTIRPYECHIAGNNEAKSTLIIEGEVTLIETHIADKKKIVYITLERKGYDNLFGIELPIDTEIETGQNIRIAIPEEKSKYFDANGDRIYNLW